MTHSDNTNETQKTHAHSSEKENLYTRKFAQYNIIVSQY